MNIFIISIIIEKRIPMLLSKLSILLLITIIIVIKCTKDLSKITSSLFFYESFDGYKGKVHDIYNLNHLIIIYLFKISLKNQHGLKVKTTNTKLKHY